MCLSTDQRRLLSPGCWHSSRINPINNPLLIFLWRYGETVWAVCRWNRERESHSRATIVHNPKGIRQVLMRWVDDYLLVTTNIDKARDFLRMMNEGHPEYGCFISRDKTYTNFAIDEQIMNVTMPNQERKWFMFCITLILILTRISVVRLSHKHENSICFSRLFALW
jgi:hypothetical protein